MLRGSVPRQFIFLINTICLSFVSAPILCAGFVFGSNFRIFVSISGSRGGGGA